MTDENKKTYIDTLMHWAQQDWLIILMAIMVLGACLYTLRSVSSYQDRINAAWIEQWNEAGCSKIYTKVNISFEPGGDWIESSYGNQNASRPSAGYGQED
jgi:hypothetical protein